MRPILASIVAALIAAHLATPAAARRPIVTDPVMLNIGLICQWGAACMARQERAMKRSLKYVGKYDPPQWRLHLCNRNAARGGASRVDWIGFDHCIRNTSLRPPSSRRGSANRR